MSKIVKKNLCLAGIFCGLVIAAIAITPIHEAGHALTAIFCGGKVTEISLIPQDGYAGYTMLHFDKNVDVTIDYLVSSAGYVITMQIAVFFLLLCSLSKKFLGFGLYATGLVFSMTATAQLIGTTIYLIKYYRTGQGAEMDIIDTLSRYPQDKNIFVATLILCFASLATTIAYGMLTKKKCTEFMSLLQCQ